MSRFILWSLPAAASALFTHEATAPGKPAELLKAIQGRLEKGADEDKDAFDKMDCWCQTYLHEKEKVVEDMQQQSDSASHDIEAQSAANTRLQYEVESHRQDLQAGQEDLKTATAIRERGAQQFSEDEQQHKQNIGSLDDAIAAMGGSQGSAAALAQLRSMRHEVRAVDRRLRASSADSPDVINGILKQMRSNFAENLEDLQHDEKTAATQHDGLARAKSDEIGAIQRRLEAKQQQAAKSGVDLVRTKEQQDKSGELLDSNLKLVAAMQAACSSNSGSFEARQQLRQAQLVDLASILSDLASPNPYGTQLLGVAAVSGSRAHFSPEDLCLFGHGLAEREWRRAARAACDKARAGNLQDAGEAVQDLVDDIKAAHANATASAQECGRNLQVASQQAQDTARTDEVNENVISSDKQTLEEQISSINSQSSRCDQAKAGLGDAREVQHRAEQSIEMMSYNNGEVIKSIRNKVPATVATKLAAVEENANKLKEAAASYDSAASKQADGIVTLLDNSMRAASRALIPLRLHRADVEEDAVNLHEKQHHAGPVSRVGCSVKMLTDKAEQYRSQAEHLGGFAEDLAYGSLR